MILFGHSFVERTEGDYEEDEDARCTGGLSSRPFLFLSWGSPSSRRRGFVLIHVLLWSHLSRIPIEQRNAIEQRQAGEAIHVENVPRQTGTAAIKKVDMDRLRLCKEKCSVPRLPAAWSDYRLRIDHDKTVIMAAWQRTWDAFGERYPPLSGSVGLRLAVGYPFAFRMVNCNTEC